MSDFEEPEYQGQIEEEPVTVHYEDNENSEEEEYKHQGQLEQQRQGEKQEQEYEEKEQYETYSEQEELGITYIGLAFCHRKIHAPLDQVFSTLKDLPIAWIYVDPTADESASEIKGSMYDRKILLECAKLQPQGYDYVVMPFCPIESNELFLYNMVTPMIASSCLLKVGGKLLSTNFIMKALQYLDPTVFKIMKEMPEPSKDERQMAFYQRSQLAMRSRRAELLADKNFMSKKFYPFCVDICRLAEFTTYEPKVGIHDRSIFTFTK
jgi:hypothetical protein